MVDTQGFPSIRAGETHDAIINVTHATISVIILEKAQRILLSYVV